MMLVTDIGIMGWVMFGVLLFCGAFFVFLSCCGKEEVSDINSKELAADASKQALLA